MRDGIGFCLFPTLLDVDLEDAKTFRGIELALLGILEVLSYSVDILFFCYALCSCCVKRNLFPLGSRDDDDDNDKEEDPGDTGSAPS